MSRGYDFRYEFTIITTIKRFLDPRAVNVKWQLFASPSHGCIHEHGGMIHGGGETQLYGNNLDK